MRVATVRSRCECQAALVAVLNEGRHVVSAYTVDRSGERDDAPAHTMGAQHDRFDVGWLCGVCGRNVLRSFWADALGWQEVPAAPAGEAVTNAAGAAQAAAGAPAVGGAPAKGSGPGVGNVPGASTVKLSRGEGGRGVRWGTARATAGGVVLEEGGRSRSGSFVRGAAVSSPSSCGGAAV